MHTLDYARQQFVDTLLAAVELRQQLVQVLALQADKRMECVYKLIYPMKCTDQDSLDYMAKLEPNFAVFARQLADARVVSTSVQTDVRFNPEKRVVADLHVYAIIQTSHHKGRIKAKSFQDYAAGVIDRLWDSFRDKPTISIRLTKKTAFEIINRMVGNDVLYALQTSISSAVRDANAEAKRNRVLEAAVESFRLKHRMKYTGDLVAFLKKNIPPGLLEEDDFHRAWKEFLVEDLMNA